MPAISYQKTATSDSAWDGPAAESNLKKDGDAAYYKKAFAWYDGSGDATKKSTYKFPHHMVSSAGDVGSANVKACVSIIGILNGGMGGAKIPEGDRQGVYDHASHHLRDAGEKPAELKSEIDYIHALALTNVENTRERRFLMHGDMRVQEFYGRRNATVMEGHAAVFNRDADLGYFTERVAPGAFSKSIKEDDVRALWNHDPNYPLARSVPGSDKNTLELSEDEQGLFCRFSPPDTTMGRDLTELMKRGDVTQMSFGFTVRGQNIVRDSDGNITRTLTDVKLYDVSPVTYPAYTQTDIGVRSITRALELLRNGPENIPNPEDHDSLAETLLREADLAKYI